MEGKTKTFIVIPIFNEDPEVVLDVVAELHAAGYGYICIVDDGSAQDARPFLNRVEGVTVLRHAINRGKGAAVKTGVTAALALGADRVVTFDGDGQHVATDIGVLMVTLDKGYDVALGSRKDLWVDMPKHKVVFNWIGNAITFLFAGVWVHDSQSGLRAYGPRALAVIDTQGDRYEYETEIIAEIGRHKLKFREVPMHVRYTEYSMNKETRQSLLNGIKTVLRMFHLR